MTISVSLGGKTYGGYTATDGSISIDYGRCKNWMSYCVWDAGEHISFQANSAICLLSIFGLYKLFNYGLLKDKLNKYSIIYEKYGDKV